MSPSFATHTASELVSIATGLAAASDLIGVLDVAVKSSRDALEDLV